MIIKLNQKGGAALEYIIVSSAAALIAIAAAGYTVSVFKQKMAKVSEKLEVDDEPFTDDLDF